MKAYVTTIGEKTTEVCCEELKRQGFDVVLLDGQEPWSEKFARFIRIAEGPCIRIDADVIPSRALFPYAQRSWAQHMVGTSFKCYCLYANDLVDSVMVYSQRAIDAIRRNLDKLDPKRPEASAWRLPELDNAFERSDVVVGMHGFFQDEAHFRRALHHKMERKQIDHYDFDLAERLLSL